MIGKAIRLQRLFNGNLRKENIVICAVDHGMFQGVQPGLKDLGARLKDAATADAMAPASRTFATVPSTSVAITRPASTERRLIGSERKRSMTPSRMSFAAEHPTEFRM